MVTREQVLGLRPEIRRVELPGMGDIHVRAMTVREKDAFEQEYLESGRRDFRARLVRATACDESGSLLFGHDDVEALAAATSPVVDFVVKAAVSLNGLGEKDYEAEKKG